MNLDGKSHQEVAGEVISELDRALRLYRQFCFKEAPGTEQFLEEIDVQREIALKQDPRCRRHHAAMAAIALCAISAIMNSKRHAGSITEAIRFLSETGTARGHVKSLEYRDNAH